MELTITEVSFADMLC